MKHYWHFIVVLVAITCIGMGQGRLVVAQGQVNVYLPLTLKAEVAPPEPTPQPPADYEQEVLAIVNQVRGESGCTPLQVEVHLMSAAEGHSTDMAVNDFFSHTGSDGSSPWERMARAGYGDYSYAAENIAAGYSTPEEVMAGWMNSPGHRANILNCDLAEIGIGYVEADPDMGAVNYRHYWTQVFATPQ